MFQEETRFYHPFATRGGIDLRVVVGSFPDPPPTPWRGPDHLKRNLRGRPAKAVRTRRSCRSLPLGGEGSLVSRLTMARGGAVRTWTCGTAASRDACPAGGRRPGLRRRSSCTSRGLRAACCLSLFPSGVGSVGSRAAASAESGRSDASITSPSHSTTARRMRCSSSRTFPG